MSITQTPKAGQWISWTKGKEEGEEAIEKKEKRKPYSTWILSSTLYTFYFLIGAGITSINRHKQNANLLPCQRSQLSFLRGIYVTTPRIFHFILAPVVHSVPPSSYNFDVNIVLPRSGSEMWSMDTHTKIAWEACWTYIFLSPWFRTAWTLDV